MRECIVCRLEDRTGESHPHNPCVFTESEPAQWLDADWWRSTNSIRDVGEQHSLARREAVRLRHAAAVWLTAKQEREQA